MRNMDSSFSPAVPSHIMMLEGNHPNAKPALLEDVV